MYFNASIERGGEEIAADMKERALEKGKLYKRFGWSQQVLNRPNASLWSLIL